VRALERIRRTLRAEPCDRAPVVAQLFGHAARVAGRTLDDYLSSGAVAARCQLEAWRHYGHDAVFAVLDLTLEAEALGAGVQRRAGLYPAVIRPPLRPDDDFGRLAVPDPLRAARMPAALELAAALRARCGDDALVVGLVQGPMTLAVQFLGMEPALCLAADEPDRFVALLDHAAAVATRFGEAQLAAGAHLVLVFDPAASPEVVPPGLFRELLAPRIASVFAAFRAAGAVGTWLHVAGRTDAILPLYARSGADIGCFDYCVDPRTLLPALEPSPPSPPAARGERAGVRGANELPLTLAGNLRPLGFVTGEAADIERESAELLRLFEPRGGFILSSGCEIPPEAKESNVAAMVRAGLGWRPARG
jgi:uroporphyrinogen decarboxylase